jgi:hypothetical protein
MDPAMSEPYRKASGPTECSRCGALVDAADVELTDRGAICDRCVRDAAVAAGKDADAAPAPAASRRGNTLAWVLFSLFAGFLLFVIVAVVTCVRITHDVAEDLAPKAGSAILEGTVKTLDALGHAK